MFLYSDQCGGFCVCNIMSRMSGHVYPQSFMILNVFTIMFDRVHMQSQSFQMIFQSLMTSYQSVILFFSAQVTGLHLEMGLLFRVILLFNRGEPLSKFFLKCVFWLPLSNEGSPRCWEVFVSKIFAFKVFDFISWTLRNSQLLHDVRNVILSVCGGVDKQLDAYIMTFLRCFVYLLLAVNNMEKTNTKKKTKKCVYDYLC